MPGRAQIFISHSCKDFERGSAPDRRARLEFARWVRDGIVERLKDNFTVLLDRKLLQPSEPWAVTLDRWLAICSGAVILLSEDSARSDWVRKEATILTWRLRVNQPLRLVPVFLGAFDPRMLGDLGVIGEELSRHQAVRLKPEESEQLTRRNAEELAEAVERVFEPLKRVYDDTPQARWIWGIAEKLRGASPEALNRARLELRIGDEDWAVGDPAVVLAERLILAERAVDDNEHPLRRAFQALQFLEPSLSNEQLADVIDRVVPIWVDPAAAIRVVKSASQSATNPAATNPAAANGTRRALAINAEFENSGADYIKRAYFCDSVISRRTSSVTDMSGEATREETVARLRENLIRELRLTGRRERLLSSLIGAKPFFVLVELTENARPLPESLLHGLLHAFQTVTFIVLAGPDFMGVPVSEVVERVEPALPKDEEVNIALLRDNLEALIQRPAASFPR